MDRLQKFHNIVVVGLGITGLSVIKHLVKFASHAEIRVIDTRDNPPGRDKLGADILVHTGGWQEEWLSQADLVITNPGIALATPQIHAVIERGVPVIGDIELFAWAVHKPVLAITGSNGKSTVTDLTGVLAKAAGLRVGVGGNIGVPALDLLTQEADLYVLELSSFQLETTSSLPLKAAAFLNLSEDHMDRYHLDINEYRAAKLRIFRHADTAIVNADDLATHPQDFTGDIVTFGLEKPADFNITQQAGENWLTDNGTPVIATSALSLVGQHNMANVLVVLALLKSAGIDYQKTLTALSSYTGLTHRCQLVADNRGIKWVNDSKATNMASTQAALSGLECKGKLYLLVGGNGKGADFTPMAATLGRLNVQLCCFGADGDDFMPLHPSAKRFTTMSEIIAWVAPQLVSGDMVMLSPACASLDQYANFMVRGDEFAKLARQYA